MPLVSGRFIGDEQDHAVDRQKHAGDPRQAEGELLQHLLEHRADDHRGNGGDHHPPEQPPLLRRACAAIEHHRHAEIEPVAPEVDQKRDGGAEVHHHQERQEPVPLLIQVPVEQVRDDDGVAEAGDREQLGHALDEREHDDLKQSHA
jgi:hypothetical protein